MTENQISPDEAARALADIAERRRQVAQSATLYPRWYFPAMGAVVGTFVAWLGMVGSPLYTPGTALIGLAYAAVFVAGTRSRRVKPHWSLYGVRGALFVVGFFLAAIVVTWNVSDFVRSLGLPSIVVGLAAGVSFAAVGALLQAAQRWILLSRVGRNAQ